MFIYCNNNPANFKDHTGENPGAATATWIGTVGPMAMAEPTILGEAIFVTGLFIIWLCNINDAGVAFPDSTEDLTDTEPAVENNPTTEPTNDNAPPTTNKDGRLTGTPGTTNTEGDKETHIGDNGKADKERHWTDHGYPKKHTIPHDHDITWNENGHPKFGPPINYPDGKYPIFP